jgi:hypothetical protein
MMETRCHTIEMRSTTKKSLFGWRDSSTTNYITAEFEESSIIPVFNLSERLDGDHEQMLHVPSWPEFKLEVRSPGHLFYEALKDRY